jgi:NifU-like protein involved in Fe-S cluster formation
MEEQIIKIYRKLLRNGFDNSGSWENPTIFLDSVGENIPVCGHVGQDYMHLYINIVDGKIDDIKYLCTCDPTANVAVEVLCGLVNGKTLAEVEAINEEAFIRIIGCQGEDLMKRIRGLLKLLNRGLDKYKAPAGEK